MTEPIKWANEKRKLSELIPWAINPAQIGKEEARRLEESLEEFGQIQTIAISPSNEIYDGHQRQIVWGASQKFGSDYEADVRVSSRELTEQERKKLVIYLRKGTVGLFDMDILANNFEVSDLLDWGFLKQELGIYPELPTLEQLKDIYGEPNERDFWPIIKVQVSPATMDAYNKIMASLPGIDETEKFSILLDRVGIDGE